MILNQMMSLKEQKYFRYTVILRGILTLIRNHNLYNYEKPFFLCLLRGMKWYAYEAISISMCTIQKIQRYTNERYLPSNKLWDYKLC